MKRLIITATLLLGLAACDTTSPPRHITFEDHLQPQTPIRFHSLATGARFFNTLCLQYFPTFSGSAKTARNLGFTEKGDDGLIANSDLFMAHAVSKTQTGTACRLMFAPAANRGEVRAFARDELMLREFDVKANPAAAGRATSLAGFKLETLDFYLGRVKNSPRKPAVLSLTYFNRVLVNGKKINVIVLDLTVR